MARWLRLCASNAGGAGSIPGWGAEIPGTTQGGQKTNKNRDPSPPTLPMLRDGTAPGPLTDTPVNPGMDSGPVQRPHSAPLSSRDCSSPAQGTPATTRSPKGPGQKRGAHSGRADLWAHVGRAQQAPHSTRHLLSPETCPPPGPPLPPFSSLQGRPGRGKPSPHTRATA